MNPNEPHFEAVETKREQIERALQPFTDDDLLLELRRRKFIGRVEYHTVTPGRYVEEGYPLMSQFRETYMGLAHELHKAYGDTIAMPGGKIETGRFDTFGWRDDPPDRKLTLVLNYVKLSKASEQTCCGSQTPVLAYCYGEVGSPLDRRPQCQTL